MNTETGEIKNFDKKLLEKWNEEITDPWIEIDEDDMTDKQKEEMQVNKHDNKSILGKLYTSHRKLSRREKNRRKRNYDNKK
jgi:hypothetical protein